MTREERRAQQHQYYLKNRDKIKKRTREWAQRNVEKRRQYSRESRKRAYLRNPDSFQKANKTYRSRHPIRVWATHTIISHRKKGLPATFSAKELSSIVEAQSQPVLCRYCDTPLIFNAPKRGPKINSASLDRIDNGKYLLLDNIQIICHACNRRKAELSHMDFISFCHMIAKKFSLKEGYHD